jgi:isopropylmalate/homocitrate/citramalate synthase
VQVDNTWQAISTLMQAADTACYAAKEAGKNRVHVWFDTDKAMRERQGEMQWANRLELAIDQDHFVLYAQKIENIF